MWMKKELPCHKHYDPGCFSKAPQYLSSEMSALNYVSSLSPLIEFLSELTMICCLTPTESDYSNNQKNSIYL